MTVSLVRRGGAQGGAPFTHTIPNDVDPTVFTNCKLSAANCADGHGSVWLTVDSDWFGKVVLAGFASEAENVSAFRGAFEICEEEMYKRINHNGLSVSGAFHVNHFTL